METVDLYKVTEYFESKYAFKRKYNNSETNDLKIPSFFNENTHFTSLLREIVDYHLNNNFANFNNFIIDDFTKDLTSNETSAPLKNFSSLRTNTIKKMFNDNADAKQSPLKKMFNSSDKRQGVIWNKAQKNMFSKRTFDGRNIYELQDLFDAGNVDNNSDMSLFSFNSIKKIVTDEMLFTIYSLKISNDLFTSCRIFVLLDNIFDKLNRIYNDIEEGLDQYNFFLKNEINKPDDPWFQPKARVIFTLSRFLQSIHLVLYIYSINTILYRPLRDDTYLFSKIDKGKQDYFVDKFERCKKNVLYKSKKSYMICDISPKNNTDDNTYEPLDTFQGILRLLSITHQLNSFL